MKVLLLGGQSPSNMEWVREIESSLKGKGVNALSLIYRNWEMGENETDVEYELGKLVELIGSDSEYVIFAKSIGTVITMKGCASGVLNPQEAFFVGFPYDAAIKAGYSMGSWIGNLQVSTTILQKAGDPFGSFERIKDVVQNPKISVLEYAREGEARDNHRYEDIEYLVGLIIDMKNGKQ